MITAEQTRMEFQPDLLICTVGGKKAYGSENEYEACRLEPGDKVEYVRKGIQGSGVVKFVSFYDGPMVTLEDGTAIWAAKDWIQRID